VSIVAILAANFTASIHGSFAANFAESFTANLENLQICREYCCEHCREFAASFAPSLQQVLPRVCCSFAATLLRGNYIFAAIYLLDYCDSCDYLSFQLILGKLEV
jgi:hypothetical protein